MHEVGEDERTASFSDKMDLRSNLLFLGFHLREELLLLSPGQFVLLLAILHFRLHILQIIPFSRFVKFLLLATHYKKALV